MISRAKLVNMVKRNDKKYCWASFRLDFVENLATIFHEIGYRLDHRARELEKIANELDHDLDDIAGAYLGIEKSEVQADYR